ncbi:MAG: WD40 repeat domain-containing protein, partial [Myxococcales bacterium]|nr:WD40 repeat domain-containing protein [Myxococcales bacterium]
CGNLALGGGNCVAAGLGYADDVQVLGPLARRGARVIGFADAAFTVGAMVDLAAGRASRFDRVGELRLRASPTSLSLSADGRTAAYIGFEGADEAIILWDLDANTRRAVLPISVGSTGPIALSADASVLAMRRSGTGDAAVDGTVSVWNLADEQRIFSIVPPDGGSFDLSLELSPDGRTLAVVTRRPNAVELWDVERRALLHTLELARDLEVGTVHFSPDGALVAVTYENFERAATLWQVDGGQRTFTREEAGPPSFSSDGRILIIPLELRAGLGLLRDP